MSLVPPQDGPLGPLFIDEVFFAHDGPRLFSVRTATGAYHLAFCVDEDEDAETVTYLYVEVDPQRLQQLRSGSMLLIDAIKATATRRALVVTANYADAPLNLFAWVPVADLPATYLPMDDARLAVPTDTAPVFRLSELRRDSVAQLRHTVALELDSPTTNITEFPLKALGRISESLQDALNALAQEVDGKATAQGPIGRDITNEVEMSVYGMRAASFVLLLGTNKRGRMLERAPLVSGSLDRLVTLLSAASNDADLVGQLRQTGPRARGRFKDFLQDIADSASGVTVTVTDGEEDRASGLTAPQVRSALARIASVEPTVRELPVSPVLLTALNLTRRTFEVWDRAADRHYSGRIPPEARQEVDGLAVSTHSYYSVVLQVQEDFAATDQTTFEQYALLAISALPE